jgi:hypothetical protein
MKRDYSAEWHAEGVDEMKAVGRVALVLAMSAGPVGAQERNIPVVVQVPVSARAAGMGNAYLLSAPDADAIFYNPALLDSARGISASLSRFGSGSQRLSAAAGFDWWDGALSFGITSLSYGAGSTDAGAFIDGEAGLWEHGSTTASEQVATVSYAQTLFGFRVGGAAKLIDQRRADERHVSGAADLGVARTLGPVTLGFSAQNLGRSPEFDAIDAKLPATLTVGAATRSRPVGPLDISLAGSSSWIRKDLHTAGGGIEMSDWPINGRTFTARVGYRWIEESAVTPMTLGVGFTGDVIGIDYAFEAVDGGRATHLITLRVN